MALKAENRYKIHNCAALITVVFATTLLIASSAAPWYRTVDQWSRDEADTDNAIANCTTEWYDLTGIKTIVENATTYGTDANEVGRYETVSYMKYDADDTIRHIFKTSQAFLLMALVLAILLLVLLFIFFFPSLRNKLMFLVSKDSDSSNAKTISIILAGLLVVFALIAFLVFLGVNPAFKKDGVKCVNDRQCSKFMDEVDGVKVMDGDTAMVHDVKWGPAEGWFMLIGAIIAGALALVLVLSNAMPLLLDSSESQGETM
jgi:hypothetical protein